MRKDRRQAEIEIQTPCPKSWETLVGDERKRFCSECSLHVHNSAALTRAEARELVQSAGERLCMRIVRDASGAPLYLDSGGSCGSAVPTGPSRDSTTGAGPIRSVPRLAGWVLAAGAGLLSACRDDAPEVVTQPGPVQQPGTIPDDIMGAVATPFEIMGEVACPEPPEVVGKVADPQEHVGMGLVALPDRDSEPEPGDSPPSVPVDGAHLGGSPAPHESMGRVARPPADGVGAPVQGGE